MQRSLFNIPDKTAFRPEEVVRLTHLDGRVLNFWAKEFEGIKPSKNEQGDLYYSRETVERILLIKRFLIEERLNKDEVRQRLDGGEIPLPLLQPKVEAGEARTSHHTLSQIKQGLKEILTILDRNAKI